MLLKICELHNSNINSVDTSICLNFDFGKRWHIFDNITEVVFDDFFQELSEKAFNEICAKQKTHQILFGKIIFPITCCQVSFLNEESVRELIIFDTCAYLCDNTGKTISSFPNNSLIKKT